MVKKNLILYISLVWFTYLQTLFCADPKVSIITSVYKGDKFIEGFLADITRQTIFDQCELIMINADSPGNEEPVIKKYMAMYPNIIYKRLDTDPGIYGVWNIAITMSKGKYITNANLDDRLAPNCYQGHAAALDANPDIMLVYSDRYYTNVPNETFEKNSGSKYLPFPQFSKEMMNFCLPSNNPMWRRTLHDMFGLFDRSFKYSGDWEMWLRAVEGGAQFKKIDEYYALLFINPQGLSTNEEFKSQKYPEDQRIVARYGYIWGRESYREMYKFACLLDKANNEQSTWPLALTYYLKAYAFNPRHAEPLIRIAQHYYYSTHNNALTYLFANRACDLPYPEDLDYDRELYEYTRWDLLGIVAWYMGQYDKGEAAVKKALEYRPDDERLKNNLKFYVDRKNSMQ